MLDHWHMHIDKLDMFHPDIGYGRERDVETHADGQ